jgi:hypothetical protein
MHILLRIYPLYLCLLIIIMHEKVPHMKIYFFLLFSKAGYYTIRRAPFPTRFRPPTTITKYSGETRPELWLADYRLACQLGGTDDDNLIIRNLPLFLFDTARVWLEHLPPGQISNWDDLVQAFVGNFQGTYVRPGNSWDL